MEKMPDSPAGRIEVRIVAARQVLDKALQKLSEGLPVEIAVSSAAELAADVRRFLDHQPIRARPASFGYRLRKLLRRNLATVGVV